VLHRRAGRELLGEAREFRRRLPGARGVNYVVADTKRWEQIAGDTLDNHAKVMSFVKRNAAAAAYCFIVRPWHFRWGATAAEVSRPTKSSTSGRTFNLSVKCMNSRGQDQD